MEWPVPVQERALLDSAAADLPVLALCDDIARITAALIQHIKIEPSADEQTESAADVQRHALWFMAIVVLRSMRAAMAVLSVGYEDQAIGYQRLIDELQNRAQKVWKDKSGNYAREWLAGRSLGKGAKLAGQDFWEFLSGPVHGNIRAVLDWLAVSQEDGSTKVVVGPERRAQVANACLTYMAGEVRDIANLLALSAGLALRLEEIDPRIRAAYAAYVPDAE